MTHKRPQPLTSLSLFMIFFRTTFFPESGKIVNLHFPWIYLFGRIYIPNLRKLKGKCKIYIFPKYKVFASKVEDFSTTLEFSLYFHIKKLYHIFQIIHPKPKVHRHANRKSTSYISSHKSTKTCKSQKYIIHFKSQKYKDMQISKVHQTFQVTSTKTCKS